MSTFNTRSSFRTAPSPDKQTDNDNIWGLIWRVREELKRIGFTPRMCVKYNYGGFDKILRLHAQHETEQYSPDLVNGIVAEYYARYEKGEINRTTYSDFRKAGLMLHEFHTTGKIVWQVRGVIKSVSRKPHSGHV